MIHRLNTQADTKKYKDWDERVMVQVRAVLGVLDESYGKDRNVQTSLGGFVLLCDRDTTRDELDEAVNLSYDLYEWADEIETDDETYVMALYLLSSDYSIVTVMRKALFNEMSKETAIQNPA